jgi:putative membrane protein
MNRIKKVLLGFLLVIVFFLALVGATDNSGAVSLVFLEYSTPAWPIAWWVLLAFVLGSVFGYVMAFGRNVRSKVAVLKTKRELSRSNTELEKLQASAEAGDVEEIVITE